MADATLDGGLCPALFKYFETAPPRLYVRAQPKGTITDDTQMTMWLAESVLASAEPKQR